MEAVLKLEEIKQYVDIPQLIQVIERGFVSYSEGRCAVPPVGFLHFDDPPGDVHIKYGYIHGGDYYVLKVASAFYKNTALNQPVNDGVVLVFSAQTGGIEFVLQDEGWLTDIRTAAAGAVTAKHLANKNIDTIGIVGTGVQARLQLELLCDVVNCKKCLVWGRSLEKAQQMINDLYQNPTIQEWGIEITLADDLDYLVSKSRLIVTTTPARTPLILSDKVQAGTHITAMGSDDHGKQELDSELLAKADRVIADSITQCVDHGECYSAIKGGQIEENAVLELGDVINNPEKGRTHENQITIADLTGVAVQDIEVANMVANAYLNQTKFEKSL
uniref:Ornithine cyclodeaminase (EC) n=1 Tax=uncultured Thiotrichaceae bacterium TaxID=298394 RepID=A0A6S6U7J6_9GAMM|nr:MAG: Ornithine cyclodeaminase (EC [uncultured Thiotrichaceae bacterium]